MVLAKIGGDHDITGFWRNASEQARSHFYTPRTGLSAGPVCIVDAKSWHELCMIYVSKSESKTKNSLINPLLK